MDDLLYNFVSFDLPALITALASAISCALVGSYLLLRRQAMMGDAISHAVLPGIVGAFLLTDTRGGYLTVLGAGIAGLLAALLIEGVRRLGRVESGAAMGVVFSIFFALGVLMIEQGSARQIDLDADCILHGQLEGVFWTPERAENFPLNLFTLSSLRELPTAAVTAVSALFVTLLTIILLYKELRLASFDGEFAKVLGFYPGGLYAVLMLLASTAVVTSFQSVGPILVVSMLVCPPATARMFTDRLLTQLTLSTVFAIISVIFGYLLGAHVPQLLGFSSSVSAAGSIAVLSGMIMVLAVIFSPRYGTVSKRLRKRSYRRGVEEEDLLGELYRDRERKEQRVEGDQDLSEHALQTADRLRQRGEVVGEGDAMSLTESGLKRARQVVRTHRLWERYLVDEVKLRPDHVHARAEELEHLSAVTPPQIHSEEGPEELVDPHGKKIPD